MKRAAILLVFALALAGCRSRPAELPPMPPPDQRPHFQSKPEPGSPWTIKGGLVPPLAMTKMPVNLVLSITDAAGKPLANATVKGRPWMPLMGHGDGEIQFTQAKNGLWSGRTTLTMAGDWDVQITVEAGGQSAKHTFSFVVAE